MGMGRVIGDGGWYFHIVDMAVLPEHQRRGIGDAILTALIDRIRVEAPPGAWVNLLADPPGRRLYERHDLPRRRLTRSEWRSRSTERYFAQTAWTVIRPGCP